MSVHERSVIASVIGRGPRGFRGPVPAHVWDGPLLLFENDDGSFGHPVNLLGPSGPSGDAQNFRSRVVALASHVTTGMPQITTAGFSRPGDGGHGLYDLMDVPPTAPDARHIQSADGQWFTLVSQPVNPMMLGAKGDGFFADQAAIRLADKVAAELGTYVQFPARTFIVKADQQFTELGATRHYALRPSDNARWFGVRGKTIIRMAPGESTDAAPRDVNIMAHNGAWKNFSADGIIFDKNGPNNPISPNRAARVYNYHCGGAIDITGNEAWVDGLDLSYCEFWNCAGTNSIVTGQGLNGVAAPMSQNVRIWRCKFKNNGWDTSDHSTIYLMAEKSWIRECTFTNDLGLMPLTDRNWVGWEIHGADSYACDNNVEGYFRTCWIAANFTNDAINLLVMNNVSRVLSRGPSLYRALSTLKAVGNVNIWGNDTSFDATPVIDAMKVGIDVTIHYNVRDISIVGNRLSCSGTGYTAAGVNLSCIVAGQALSSVEVRSNKTFGATYGVHARLNPNNGFINDLVEIDNINTDLGLCNAAVSAIGSSYRADDATVGFGRVSIRGNRYVAPNSTNFGFGVRLTGRFDEAMVDECVFSGMQTFPSGSPYSLLNEATITRRLGRQLCTGTVAPTTGTQKAGDKWYNFAPTRLRAIHDWTYDGANWRPNCGMSYGTTSERPVLTAQDYGFPYQDTTINNKIIVWTASGWQVPP